MTNSICLLTRCSKAWLQCNNDQKIQFYKRSHTLLIIRMNSLICRVKLTISQRIAKGHNWCNILNSCHPLRRRGSSRWATKTCPPQLPSRPSLQCPLKVPIWADIRFIQTTSHWATRSQFLISKLVRARTSHRKTTIETSLRQTFCHALKTIVCPSLTSSSTMRTLYQ